MFNKFLCYVHSLKSRICIYFFLFSKKFWTFIQLMHWKLHCSTCLHHYHVMWFQFFIHLIKWNKLLQVDSKKLVVGVLKWGKRKAIATGPTNLLSHMVFILFFPTSFSLCPFLLFCLINIMFVCVCIFTNIFLEN